MADLDESVLVEPVADTSSQLAPVSTVSELTKVVPVFDQQALLNVNAAPAPKRTVESVFPKLPEQSVVGYDHGTKKPMVVVQLGGFLVERVTAYDFILMQRAALKDGIKLFIVSAWRSNEEQTRLRNERCYANGSLTPLGRQKGIAARPGYSNHQKGTTLDLKTDMTVADLRNGRFSKEYFWLLAHAAEYGFERTVESEPWHWEHKPNSIIGHVDSTELSSTFLSADVVASSSMSNNSAGADLFRARDAYDWTKAYERSANMCTSSLATIYANRAAESIHKSARLGNYVAEHTQADTRAKVKPPVFDAASLSPLVYDFTSGLWGDKEPV